MQLKSNSWALILRAMLVFNFIVIIAGFISLFNDFLIQSFKEKDIIKVWFSMIILLIISSDIALLFKAIKITSCKQKHYYTQKF